MGGGLLSLVRRRCSLCNEEYELQQQGRAYLEDAQTKVAQAREYRSSPGLSREAMISARESIEKSAKAITLFTGRRPPTKHKYKQKEIDATLQALPDIPARSHNFLRVLVRMNILYWVNTLGTYAPEYRYASKDMRNLFTKEDVDLAIEWAEDSLATAFELLNWIDDQSIKS